GTPMPPESEWRYRINKEVLAEKEAAQAAAQPVAEPPRQTYPLPGGNFGEIQDEGQLLSRIREVANKPERGIRLDFHESDLNEDMTPGVHAQAQLEAIQAAAEREGYRVNVQMPRPGRRRGTAWVTVTGEGNAPRQAVQPMTTPPPTERREPAY